MYWKVYFFIVSLVTWNLYVFSAGSYQLLSVKCVILVCDQLGEEHTNRRLNIKTHQALIEIVRYTETVLCPGMEEEFPWKGGQAPWRSDGCSPPYGRDIRWGPGRGWVSHWWQEATLWSGGSGRPVLAQCVCLQRGSRCLCRQNI